MRSYYEMYSYKGEKACQQMVDSINALILSNQRVTKQQIQELYDNGQKTISKQHPEVYDTEPRGHIASQISKTLKEAGYGFYINSWGDVEDN